MPWKISSWENQRWEFVREWLRHRSGLAAQCRRWEVSRKTAYKWIRRFEQGGRNALSDGSHVAARVHNRPSGLWLGRIRRWRALHPTWGAPKLRWLLRRRFGCKSLPSEAAISRWLKRWGLSKKPRRRGPKGPILARPKLTVARRPNEVWTVDFKGWYRTGDGTRVDPLTVRDQASCRILGFELMVRPNLAKTRRGFENIFRQYGLPRVIRSDNGRPFGAPGALGLTRLSAWWVKLGIRVEFIALGRPDQNGAHEQMHRVYKNENLQPAAFSLQSQKRRSRRWQWRYNHARPHEALGMKVPAAVYRPSPRKMPGKLLPWRYPKQWRSRRVKGKGMISLDGRGRFIGEAFEGERIGLKPVRRGVDEVYFGPLLLGELWANETTGIRARWYRKRSRK